MTPHQTDQGDWVCEHGTALDVHCCHCHSGFLFDLSHVCEPVAVSEVRCLVCGRVQADHLPLGDLLLCPTLARFISAQPTSSDEPSTA